jgi:hypothetical protein
MHLTVGFYDDWSTGPATDIISQLAIEAGFTFSVTMLGRPGNCSAAFLEKMGPSCPKSFSPFFEITAQHFDITGPWWAIDHTRLLRQDFAPPWVDNSLALFTVTDKSSVSIDWLGFAAPFTGTTWLAILAVCIMTGISTFMYETGFSKNQTLREIEVGMINSAEGALAAMINGESMEDTVTAPAKMINFSFMFFILVTLAAYTGNTAAFLTVVGSETNAPISKLSDIIDDGYTACAYASDGILEEIGAVIDIAVIDIAVIDIAVIDIAVIDPIIQSD